ncbi:cupin domain-containing protein [Dysgonomonas sp. 511]|uniref:cupin domain-containing protein n=1 Tax=Dysgonomonas sp. 511 TaxID=2302930 RepID=UPI0013CF5805|nr:cupin domain-containing protein [Dysgonomonas sp. 511]NDV78208.1 cupin domain-containing protein [Dysgonomonas sp. 511]
MNKIQSKTFFEGKKETIYKAGEGITRQFFAYDNNIMTVRVFFEKGAIGALHAHPHTQSTYVISGVFDATVDGQTVRMQAGDAYYAHPDVLHGCVCVEEGVLLEIFSPIREDMYETIIK